MAKKGSSYRKSTRRSHRKGTRRATRRMRGGFIQLNPADVNDSSMNAANKVNLAQGGQYLSMHKDQHGGRRMRGGIVMPTLANGTPLITTNSPPPATTGNAATTGGYRMSGGIVMPTLANGTPLITTNSPPPATTGNAATTGGYRMSGGMAPVGDTGMLDAGLRDSARLTPIDQANSEIVAMRDQSGGRRRRSSRRSKKSRKSKKSKKSRSRRMRGGSAPVGDSTMLLSSDMSKGAVAGMNPEWKLAENPASFDPK